MPAAKAISYDGAYRDLEEIMAERGLSVDHATIWRWVQHYAPILNQRMRRETESLDVMVELTAPEIAQVDIP